MNEKIIEELKRIEEKENIRILYAVESGSRAWGFASSDSDYDVRFIYVRNKDFYIRLDETRDVIEYPINELLDINGWDISKVLKLIYSSNPTIFEWIQSPIVYRTSKEIEELKKLGNRYFSNIKLINHYYRIALEHYNKYINGNEDVKLKKYFYILRSLSAAKYVSLYNDIPPIEFSKLRNVGIPSKFDKIIDDLLDIKINKTEMKTISRISELDQYIEEEFNKLDKLVHSFQKEEDKSWDEINECFRKLLEKWEKNKKGVYI